MTPRRRGPTRQQVLLRRVLALALLLAGLGGAVWLATAAVGGGSGEPPPATTAAGPARLKTCNIAFPEGFTRREMADKVGSFAAAALRECKFKPAFTEKAYLAATRRAAAFADAKGRPEGFLFPATYEFSERTTAKQLAAAQLKAFRRAWAKVSLGYARSKNLTPYDVLVIASMVEEETLAPDERPLVAAVIYNRLKIGMPLGIDATVRYGLDVPNTESLRQSHLDSDNPYNTRKLAGLPPTPITNPGLASMQAAAHPADVDYLYFVRKPDRVHHFFTASFDEFQRKTAEYGFQP